ncbi:MAG: Asp-tRNA(Asn)/Glu-tRNA(Gln) amidotransferase subunit GatB [Patescibacteria group bacterium]
MKYIPTIGLEIHVELKTKTKMFCNSLNDPNEKHPNINVCPVCMGHPGTLPVINKEAVKKVLMLGRALNGKIADYSRFDRKNYFYPDLPKGYQISQYKYPLVLGGELNGVRITRIHLEEDTGKLIHTKDGSLVDFNRAGVPLMELVTEPDIKSGEEVRKFAEELQLILRYLDISDADMEKGQMRVEANISLLPQFQISNLPDGKVGLRSQKLGTKVEIKNLNSFRAVERAINYEIERQEESLNEGKKVIQETRGWDENKQRTFSQREKEESHDYRYFPEPDLPPLQPSSIIFQLSTIPELPQQKRKRFKEEFSLKKEQIEILIKDKKFSEYFERVVSELSNRNFIQLAVNYLTTDLQSLMKEKSIGWSDEDVLLITSKDFAELIFFVGNKKITSRVAKDVLKIMIETGKKPKDIIEEKNLMQKTDQSLIDEIADQIINENLKVLEDYRAGKESALQFLVGRGMKLTKGSIDPEILKNILRKKINEQKKIEI